jgi:hypothetical protein
VSCVVGEHGGERGETTENVSGGRGDQRTLR